MIPSFLFMEARNSTHSAWTPVLCTYSVLLGKCSSPLRTVPVLLVPDPAGGTQLVVNDSSVICQYIDEAFVSVGSLQPSDVSRRAHGRFLEEYADTRVADVLIWKLWNQASSVARRGRRPHACLWLSVVRWYQKRIMRGVWGRVPDAEIVRYALEVDLPQLLVRCTAPDWLCGSMGVCDRRTLRYWRLHQVSSLARCPPLPTLALRRRFGTRS